MVRPTLTMSGLDFGQIAYSIQWWLGWEWVVSGRNEAMDIHCANEQKASQG